MLDIKNQSNFSGPTTTFNSNLEGRLKVDAGGNRKKKKAIIKKYLKKQNG